MTRENIARKTSPWRRWLLWWPLAMMLVFAPLASGQDRVPFSAVLETGPFYVPQRWMPVRLEARNESDQPLDAVAVLPVSGQEVSVELHLPVRLPARSRSWQTMYAAFPETPALPKEARDKSIISIVELRTEAGARLGRSDLLARPEGSLGGAEPGVRRGLMLLSSSRDEFEGGFDVGLLSNALSKSQTYGLTPATVDPARLPRLWAGYDGARLVVLDGIDVQTLDQAQRQALIQHVLRGGVLLLPQPGDFTGTWIEPHMPVSWVGERLAARVDPAGKKPLAFIERLPITEAIAGGGTVVLEDEHYVHAAYRRLGLGRIVFTSFPANALDWSDPRALELMVDLLDLGPMPADWSDSLLPQRRDQIMEAMLGAPTSPWSVAAGVAGAYVLMVLVMQVLAPGARRPAGFVASLLLATLVTGAFVVLTIIRRAEAPLSGAGLTTVDLGAEGGGLVQEAVAFFGRSDANLSLSGRSHETTLRPLAAIGPRPVVRAEPFAAPGAGVSAGRIERVWKAAAPLPQDQRVTLTAQFGPRGLTIEADNQLGKMLQAPLLIWNRRLVRLSDIPVGSGRVAVAEVNRPGDWTNVTVLAGEVARLRGQILEIMQSPSPDVISTFQAKPPLVAGWVDDAGSSTLLDSSVRPDVWRGQVLVRVPLEIRPGEPGTDVLAPAVYCRLLVGGAGLPFDQSKQEWIPSMQPGTWILGFAAPEQIGTIRPSRVTIQADINAPRHIVRLQRGVVMGDVPRESASARDLVVWQGVTGAREVSFEAAAGDFDSQGRVWLQLVVDPIDTGPAQVVPHWSFRSISAGIEGRVIGPSNE